MEFLSWILAIVGLVASIIGILFSYITYVSPMVRFKWYLKRKEGWKYISPRVEGWSSYYQFTNHPEFTLEAADDHRWERDEPWMKRVMRPDKNCFAYQEALKVNGNIIHTENFISMDGGRIYIPIPKVKSALTDNEEDNTYYYDSTQILLAGVLGRYHNYAGLKDVCDKTGIRANFIPEDGK